MNEHERNELVRRQQIVSKRVATYQCIGDLWRGYSGRERVYVDELTRLRGLIDQYLEAVTNEERETCLQASTK